MEAYLAHKPSVQVNKIAFSCEIYSGPHDTKCCMKNPEQAFVDYASSCNNEVGGKSFTTNQGPRNFNEATSAWKDKPNFNWARAQTFTSPQNGSFLTYSSNVPHGPFNYQSKLERVLSNFDSHQERRLSSLGTQLKQQQDKVINKINTLWKVVSDKFNNASTRDIVKNSIAHVNVVSHNHLENWAPPNKGIIKSPSKLLYPKYQAQSSLGEQFGNFSSPKRVLKTCIYRGFAAALAVLVTGASQSRQHGALLTLALFPSSNVKTRWIREVPIKINILAWKVINDYLPSRFNMSRRGIEVNSISCPLCNHMVETSRHLFFSCDFSAQIMSKIRRWWDLEYNVVDSVDSWINWISSLRLSSKLKRVFEVGGDIVVGVTEFQIGIVD
ncbi:MAK10-like protein [Tanacetum coccineum]